MSGRGTEREDPGRSARARSRWPVACAAAALLWTVAGYCRGGDSALALFAAAAAAVAVALPRALPRSARWVVWTWLGLTVACLAANVARLAPPEHLAGAGHTLERLVTAVYAVGVTALFFKPGSLNVTAVALACLPLTLFTLGRNSPATALDGGAGTAAVWGLIALLALLDQAQRLTQPRPHGAPAPTARDLAVRVLALSCACLLAAGLRRPIEAAAVAAQRRLFGLVSDAERGAGARRGLNLSLGQTPPENFGNRFGPVLLVRAGGLPGYLRETVYTAYRAGQWLAPKPGLELRPSSIPLEGESRNVYPLAAAAPAATASVWRVEVLAPRLLAGFCLPGNAVSLACEGPGPLADANGGVTADEEYPERYDVRVLPRTLADSAFPQPGGFSDPAYLLVPPALAAHASNWVAACEGLAAAGTARDASACVERHFARAYTYRLGLELRASPDPLVDFMRRREGSCAQFASAAALMLRSRGLPARVVGGYVCYGWNPWLERWVVRERDGHAWVELWDGARGRWILVDPTPPDGHPTMRERPGWTRLAVDWLFASWKRALFALKSVNALVLLADAGAALALLVWHMAWSPAGAIALAGLLAIAWLRRRLRRLRVRPEDRLRAELAEGMKALARRASPEGLGRRAFESWGEWLARARPALGEKAFGELSALAEGYQELRYSVRLDEAAARAWLARARRARPGRPARRGARA